MMAKPDSGSSICLQAQLASAENEFGARAHCAVVISSSLNAAPVSGAAIALSRHQAAYWSFRSGGCDRDWHVNLALLSDAQYRGSSSDK
jgi:hypothetical protein